MIFIVDYTQNNVACRQEFEAADLETCKKAVNQWRVAKLRFRRDTIKIDSIEAKWRECDEKGCHSYACEGNDVCLAHGAS